MTIQVKAVEQYFSVLLFILLYKVVLTFESSVDEFLTCDHSVESCWALSYDPYGPASFSIAKPFMKVPYESRTASRVKISSNFDSKLVM